MEAYLQQQKRVNEILSRSVEKHSFAEKAMKVEFDKIRQECETLKAQNKSLREQKKIDDAHLTAAHLTPPDSSASDKSTRGSYQLVYIHTVVIFCAKNNNLNVRHILINQCSTNVIIINP